MFAETKLNLDRYRIRPAEGLGQHFLVDEKVVESIAGSIVNGAHVIEIGAGTGNITKALARHASSVVAVEIDSRYKPILDEVARNSLNISILYGNILDIGLGRLLEADAYNQVVANLPFHITEPFLWMMIGQSIESAILLLGDNIARQMIDNSNKMSFGRMSLLVQTFFETTQLAKVSKESCFPKPRTDCALVEIHIKSSDEVDADPASHVFARLFTTARNHPTVRSVLKNAIGDANERSSKGTLDKRDAHRRDRAIVHQQSRLWIREFNNNRGNMSKEKPDLAGLVNQQTSSAVDRMGLDESVLQKPFLKLDNQDIRNLVNGVKSYFR